jgi:hypothetical protein
VGAIVKEAVGVALTEAEGVAKGVVSTDKATSSAIGTIKPLELLLRQTTTTTTKNVKIDTSLNQDEGLVNIIAHYTNTIKTNMNYKHTQVGHLIIYASLFVILPLIFLLSQNALSTDTIITLVFIFFLIASFSTLTVTIPAEHIQIKFGYGLFKKNFPLKNISSVKTVRNSWYHGWGIRIWFWPFMQIYNVSGFDAVEMKMKNGRRYRIGTDEPKKLKVAINQALSTS